jgi:hypothetical protein
MILRHGPAGPHDPAAGQPAPGLPARDAGLARERTELAWTRTAISFAALGGAGLKTVPLAGAIVLTASGLVWAAGRLVRSAAHAGAAARDEPRLMAFITVAVTAVSAAALLLALLGGAHPLR